VVRELHSAGHAIVFTHLGQTEEANALALELESGGGPSVQGLESDTSSEEAVLALYAQHKPDVLVHCAGIALDRAIWKQDVSDWDAVLGVNLRGAWLQARAAAPHMRASGWGRIILIGSINGTRGKFGQTAYASSKAGLHGLAKSLAKELGPKGVTVNVVEPGWIETPMTSSLGSEFQDAARAETLTGRLGQPRDIAATVTFLASEAASHITGNILRVDGGQST
jgi:NAD(P)-dependent dehydrogenase (short-subunit alcohol dehydrogenase family)